jgi:hypothetical protein
MKKQQIAIVIIILIASSSWVLLNYLNKTKNENGLLWYAVGSWIIAGGMIFLKIKKKI